MTKTYFALSDIHGRRVTLGDFEDRGFEVNNENHIMVFLGDYFDRGEENYQVLRFLEETYRLLGPDRCKLLIGNHDEFLIYFLNDIKSFDVGTDLPSMELDISRWLRNGGNKTLKELFGSINTQYTEAKKRRVEKLLKFVSLLEPFYETEQFIFTHAAINENRETDTWDREFFNIGMNTDKTILIGHTPHEYLEDHIFDDKYLPGVVAISTKETKCTVFNIDNGNGDNIVALKVKN